ncbi:hypothetical protein CEXT_763381 [Caerostris extrusa]|uniref:Uncharacterized protein n=1 Tax=Caerostris extrusa TaxID=172846 RepID=A0AAV4MIQ1_CAEEX|nr:hypothetical protein CEXT_763381 [Caerostris extrusa]
MSRTSEIRLELRIGCQDYQTPTCEYGDSESTLVALTFSVDVERQPNVCSFRKAIANTGLRTVFNYIIVLFSSVLCLCGACAHAHVNSYYLLPSVPQNGIFHEEIEKYLKGRGSRVSGGSSGIGTPCERNNE